MKTGRQRLAPLDAREIPREIDTLVGKEELTRFLDTAAVPLHLVGADGTILWANAAELKMLGYSRGEYVGRNVREFHVDEAVIADILQHLNHNEDVGGYKARLRTKDGSIRHVAITSNVRSEGGRFIHSLCFTRDLTEENRAAELQERLAAIVESSDDAIISKDLDGRIRSWNRGAERIFGYTAAEVIGKPVTILAVPDRIDEIPDILGRIRKGERIDHYETRRRTKDGRVLAISLTVSPIRDSSGTIVGASKIARDITERVLAEEALRRALQQLEVIVRASPVPILALTRDGAVTLWNPAAERVFGWTAAEVMGQPLPFIPEDKREEHRAMRERDLAGDGFTNREITRRCKNGSLVDLSVSTAPLKDADGKVVGIMSVYVDVTERKRMERELRDSERRLAARERYLQAVLESMPECLKVLGPNGEVFEMNRAGLQMIEADHLEHVVGACAYSFINEPDRDAFRAVNESVFHGGAGGSLEFRITGLKGSERTFETRVVPLRNEDDVVAGALSVTRDITDRKRAEEALRASEERYRVLSESVPHLLWSCLPDGRCDYLSSQWVEYTGVPESEQLDLRWLNVIHPEDYERTSAAWHDAVEQRGEYDLEYRLRRHDGVYRWFKTRGRKMRDSEGQIVKWFGTCTDIHDRKVAEEERTAALAREQEARQTAELLNSVGPLLAAELDTQVLTQKVTDLATQLTGAQFGALFHSSSDERGEQYFLYTLSGAPREAFANFPMPRTTHLFGRTFRGEGVVRSDDVLADRRYGQNPPYHGMPEGHLPVRSYLAVPVLSRSGEVLGGLLFGHAQPNRFTEQHEQLAVGIAAQAAIALDNARLFADSQKAQGALERSNAELRRANEDLEQFAYSASHDLKEPLRMVSVYSQILQRRYRSELDEAGREYLDYAIEGARRMEMLVRDLLAYTQAVTVKHEDVTTANASVVLQMTLGNLRGVIADTGATIESEELPMLLVQDVHLLQLLQNLIGNALKYHGDAPPFVRVWAKQEQNMWRLSVRDNGIGIDPEYAHQVFGIFKRLHNNDKYEGTGIGLAICQKIVERYGGRIWVESEGPGRGSTFHFTLPAAEPEES